MLRSNIVWGIRVVSPEEEKGRICRKKVLSLE